MAQVYKMMLGTSGRQWEQLTVREDGTMMLYFHGTDRSVTTQVTLIEDGAWKGWLRSEGGSLYPGIESGKWQSATQMRNEKLEMRNENEEMRNEEEVQGTVPAVGSDAESERTTEGLSPMCAEPVVQALRGQAPCNPPSATHTGDSPREQRQRRQRKPRKPRVERQASAVNPQTSDISHQPSDIDHQPSALSHQPSSTLKAVGMVAAATVALFVIYETGLLIPLGLIGLATGGILK